MKKPSLFLLATIIFIYLVNSYKNSNGFDFVNTQNNLDNNSQPVKALGEIRETNQVDFLNNPAGLNVAVFAEDLGKVRVIKFDPQGTMLVSVPSRGQIIALPDRNNDGVADEQIVVVRGLKNPHGIEFSPKDPNHLYVAEEDAVSIFDYDANNLVATNKRKIIDLPVGAGHSTRTLLYLPNEDKLLISVGSSCDVCQEKDERRAAILMADPDGSNLKVYASGLRNSVFMRINPLTNEVWATDNGRDHLGDNLPPDEINIIKEEKFYGWPYAYGNKIQDKQFDPSSRAKDLTDNSEPSWIDLQAHSAVLGLEFIPKESNWPKEYQGNLFVAYHGSWNRSVPTGYKVARFILDDQGTVMGQEDFITGFMNNGQVLGRPVDVVFYENNLYISDDQMGVVYRVEIKS